MKQQPKLTERATARNYRVASLIRQHPKHGLLRIDILGYRYWDRGAGGFMAGGDWVHEGHVTCEKYPKRATGAERKQVARYDRHFWDITDALDYANGVSGALGQDTAPVRVTWSSKTGYRIHVAAERAQPQRKPANAEPEAAPGKGAESTSRAMDGPVCRPPPGGGGFPTLEQHLWEAEIDYALAALSPPMHPGGPAANHAWGSRDAVLYLKDRAYDLGLSVQDAINYLLQRVTYSGKPPPADAPKCAALTETLEHFLWDSEVMYRQLFVANRSRGKDLPELTMFEYFWGGVDPFFVLLNRAHEQGMTPVAAVDYLFEHADRPAMRLN